MAETGGSGWLDAIRHVISDTFGGIVGGFIGSKLDGAASTSAGVGNAVGSRIKERIDLNRQDLMQTLLSLKYRDGVDVDALIDLLVEMNRPPRFLLVFGRHFTEDWVVAMLLKIKSEHRGLAYPVLNEVLRQGDRERFFALLETYDNDGWVHFLAVAWDVVVTMLPKIDDALGRKIAQLHGVANIQEAVQQVQQWTTAAKASARRPIAKWNIPRKALEGVFKWLDI